MAEISATSSFHSYFQSTSQKLFLHTWGRLLVKLTSYPIPFILLIHIAMLICWVGFCFALGCSGVPHPTTGAATSAINPPFTPELLGPELINFGSGGPADFTYPAFFNFVHMSASVCYVQMIQSTTARRSNSKDDDYEALTMFYTSRYFSLSFSSLAFSG